MHDDEIQILLGWSHDFAQEFCMFVGVIEVHAYIQYPVKYIKEVLVSLFIQIYHLSTSVYVTKFYVKWLIVLKVYTSQTADSPESLY